MKAAGLAQMAAAAAMVVMATAVMNMTMAAAADGVVLLDRWQGIDDVAGRV